MEGCDVVNDSEHSLLLGIPVALLGRRRVLATVAGAIAWWRAADRRGLLAAYGIGLASLPVLAWLTYLELAVIEAICIWCVTYALARGGRLDRRYACADARPDDEREGEAMTDRGRSRGCASRVGSHSWPRCCS